MNVTTERMTNMNHYTGSFVEMDDLRQLENRSSTSYFNDFCENYSMKKLDTRASICVKKDTTSPRYYFTGADSTSWWGFSGNVIFNNDVDYLIARGQTPLGKEVFLVLNINDKKDVKLKEHRIMFTATIPDENTVTLHLNSNFIDYNNSNNSGFCDFGGMQKFLDGTQKLKQFSK